MSILRHILLASIALVATTTVRAQSSYSGLVFANVGGRDLHLELRVPAGSGPFPLAIHIHGGGWSGGEYTVIPPLGNTLLAQGFAVASVEYRLTSQAGQWGTFPVTFPAQIDDVKGAVRWLRANAATYHLDTTRFASFGESAGGHLSELVALSGGAAVLEGDVGGNLAFSSRVQAAVSYYGPSDMLHMNPDVTTPPGSGIDHDAPTAPEALLFGWSAPGQGLGDIRAHLADPTPPYPALVQLVLQGSPITWVDASDPPLFLAHGTNDTTVATNQSTRLSAALNAAGVVHELHDLPAIGHGFSGGAIDTLAAAFLVERLNGPGRAPVGSTFCFGDGSGTACPCGNASFSGANLGCKNFFVVGASLTAFGAASVSNDTLVLHGDAMPNSSALYFQGTTAIGAGAGAVFGDGLRCVSSSVVRLATQTNIVGSSQYPTGIQPSVSVRGAVTSGSTWRYQVWYRDPNAFCTAATWNLTNGLAVTWLP
jgi:acetyl esterase/lipase